MKTITLKNNRKTLAFLLLLCSISFINCKKSQTPAPTDPIDNGNNNPVNTDTPKPVDIYVCDYEYDATGNKTYSEYWKNGSVVQLREVSNLSNAITIAGNYYSRQRYLYSRTRARNRRHLFKS